MAFDIISIIYIAIIVLFALIGLKRGFFKTLVSFLKGIISFVISILLCEPLARLLTNSKIGSTLAIKISDVLNARGGLFTATITLENKEALLSQALTEIKIPEVLHEFISSLVVVPSEGSVTIGNALALSITYYIFIAITFIVLLILARLAVRLIAKIFKSLEQIPFVGVTNKLMGTILNAFIGFVIVCVISYGITCLIPLNNEISSFLIETMRLEDSEVFTISKFFYENNFLLTIIAAIQSLFA